MTIFAEQALEQGVNGRHSCPLVRTQMCHIGRDPFYRHYRHRRKGEKSKQSCPLQGPQRAAWCENPHLQMLQVISLYRRNAQSPPHIRRAPDATCSGVWTSSGHSRQPQLERSTCNAACAGASPRCQPSEARSVRGSSSTYVYCLSCRPPDSAHPGTTLAGPKLQTCRHPQTSAPARLDRIRGRGSPARD